MMASALCAGLWLAAVVAAAAGPARLHWRAVWALIGAGVPLLGWITFAQGPLAGLACFALGVLALRLPLRNAPLMCQEPRPSAD